MTKPDDKRTGSTSLAGALRLVTDIAIPESIATMTDEQWATHDERIAASRRASNDADSRERSTARTKDLLAAGFPQRALDASTKAAKRPAIARLESWDPDGTSILVLSGDKGCGKTVAATWWARRQSITPRFVRASTFAASSRYTSEARASWMAAPALVLDDLGTEYLDAAGSFLVDLDELFDVFYGDRRPLVITTNLKLEQFRERYGARIADRMREAAVFYAVSGGSLRGQP